MILNITLIVTLISLSVIEKYPTRIYNKIKTLGTSESSFLKNWKYKQQVGLYEYYQKTGQIVMLGNSITYGVNWNELLNREDIINRGIGSDKRQLPTTVKIYGFASAKF